MTDHDLRDVLETRPELSRRTLGRGYSFDMVEAEIDLGEAGVVTRQFFTHLGAVAVVALRGEPGAEEVLMVRQYRHPVGARAWEIPAGLLDTDGEEPLTTAVRELAEEADHAADRWDVLVDYWTTPGSGDEAIRVFLARDLRGVAAFEREHEEAEMEQRWVPLDEAVRAVLEGRVHNPSAAIGVLAAAQARSLGWATLRPADAPWPEHPAYREF